MMRLMPFGAFSLGIVGWVLLGLTFMNLAGGPMEERTCQTACLQTYFFSASAAGGIGLILGILGLNRPDFRSVTYVALVLLIPLCCLIGGLILIGNLG
jgi:Trk-type K+ transport system membrane component